MLIKLLAALLLLATLVFGATTFATRMTDPAAPDQDTSRQVMLILRGIANAENPRGQLDDEAALAYARRLGFKGKCSIPPAIPRPEVRRWTRPWSGFGATNRSLRAART
jgi:hypothetical protein